MTVPRSPREIFRPTSVFPTPRVALRRSDHSAASSWVCFLPRLGCIKGGLDANHSPRKNFTALREGKGRGESLLPRNQSRLITGLLPSSNSCAPDSTNGGSATTPPPSSPPAVKFRRARPARHLPVRVPRRTRNSSALKTPRHGSASPSVLSTNMFSRASCPATKSGGTGCSGNPNWCAQWREPSLPTAGASSGRSRPAATRVSVEKTYGVDVDAVTLNARSNSATASIISAKLGVSPKNIGPSISSLSARHFSAWSADGTRQTIVSREETRGDLDGYLVCDQPIAGTQ